MDDKLLVTISESARRQSISVRHHWTLIASGRFGPELISLGRAVRVRSDELTAWIEAGAPPRREMGCVEGAKPMSAGKWKVVSADHPCDICGKPDWCGRSDPVIRCMRVWPVGVGSPQCKRSCP